MDTARRCEIGPIEHSECGGVSRVSAMVDGRPIWFESADAPLRPSAEVFLTALLIPTLHQRRPIRIHAPLSPVWRGNVDKLAALLNEWWDYPRTAEIESDGETCLPAARADAGQCFSGGVDSFYSLLRGRHRTGFLVTVHGFDIPHFDCYRMRRFRESLAAVSQAVGKPSIVVRTNLRRHPLFRSVPWERTHGGALAAVGHALSDVIGGLVIPSSYARNEPPSPHGSHWDVDPLWSSESSRIVHDDPDHRLNKLKKIDSEPLVQRHLRVCWQNLAVWGNCSRCDKCLCTMLSLAARGQLEHYTVFDRQTPLPRILDRMGPPFQDVRERYAGLIEEGLPPDVAAAVRRLLDRDRRPPFCAVRRFVSRAHQALARLHV